MNKKLFVMIALASLFLVGCASSNKKVDEIPKPNEYVIENDDVNEFYEVKKIEKEEVVESKKDESTQLNQDKETVKKTNIPEKKPIEQVKPKEEVNKPVNQPEEKPKVPPVVEKPSVTVPVESPKEEVVETPVKQVEMEKEVLNKINNYRIQNGLQPLTPTKYYQDKADAHALEMAEQRALWHGNTGECITNHPDPFNAWISSPEHNEIILKENNTVGVVSIYYVDGYYYSVFRTYWM